jgi:hypothetical protein
MRRRLFLLKFIDDNYIRNEKALSLEFNIDPFLIELFELLRRYLFRLYVSVGSRHLYAFELDYIGSDFAPFSDYGCAFVKKVGIEQTMHNRLLKYIEEHQAAISSLPFELLTELQYWYYMVEWRLFLNGTEATLRCEAQERRSILRLRSYVIKGFDEKNSPVYTHAEGYDRPLRELILFEPLAVNFNECYNSRVDYDRGFCPYFYYIQVKYHLLDTRAGTLDKFLQDRDFSLDGLSIPTTSEILIELLRLDSEILC